MLITKNNIDKIVRYERKQPNVIVVDWMLGNVCNYKCHYCFPFANNETKKVPPLEIFEHNLNYLIDKIKENGLTPYFVLSGGEPTVYNQILDLLRIIKDNNFRSLMVTNASRTVNWWQKNIDLIDDVYISYHPQYKNEKHILEVIKTLKDKHITTTLMASPRKELFSNLMEAHKYFVENDILSYSNLCVKTLHIKEQLYNYTEDQLDFIFSKFCIGK